MKILRSALGCSHDTSLRETGDHLAVDSDRGVHLGIVLPASWRRSPYVAHQVRALGEARRQGVLELALRVVDLDEETTRGELLAFRDLPGVVDRSEHQTAR